MRRATAILLAWALLVSPASLLAGQKKDADPSQIGRRDINKGSWNLYSPERELALGSQLARESEQNMVLLHDPVVTAYIEEVAERIVRHSDARMPIQLRVVDSSEVNAFALPGGYFFVNTGLLLETQSEAELAGVIAHEVAHVAARHATRQMTRAQIWNWMSVPLLLFGGPVPYAIEQSLTLAVPLTFLKFNRNAEREADFLGLQYMYEAGYDPVAFVDFFERTKQLEKGHQGSIAKAFSTHPMTKDRIAAAERTIERVLPPRQEYVVDTSRHAEVKAYLTNLLIVRELQQSGSGPVLHRRDGPGNPETKPGTIQPF
jgi:predicted Zn-dependent protease